MARDDVAGKNWYDVLGISHRPRTWLALTRSHILVYFSHTRIKHFSSLRMAAGTILKLAVVSYFKMQPRTVTLTKLILFGIILELVKSNMEISKLIAPSGIIAHMNRNTIFSSREGVKTSVRWRLFQR